MYALNRTKTGDDPAKLKVRMILKLAAPPAGR